jgi:hypothetical protein
VSKQLGISQVVLSSIELVRIYFQERLKDDNTGLEFNVFFTCFLLILKVFTFIC